MTVHCSATDLPQSCSPGNELGRNPEVERYAPKQPFAARKFSGADFPLEEHQGKIACVSTFASKFIQYNSFKGHDGAKSAEETFAHL